MGQTTSELVTKYSQKAAGYYREIIDATVEPVTSFTNNVVVVGQFAQGPVMRPVLCKNATIAHAIFGQRNAKLEAKGNYGMLMTEMMLEQGQVYVLNLKNIDQFNETLQVKQLAVNSNEQDQLLTEKIGTVYDTGKFWKVDPMYSAYGDGNVLSFASILQDTVTVVVEKYWHKDYNYPISKVKKFNESFTGEGLNDDDFVTDFLIRVHVFKTDLASAKLSVQNAFVNGKLNLAALEAVKADVNSKFFATYTGTIGDIIDINGRNLNIATVMNADEQASGVHVALNTEAIALNGVDLTLRNGLVFPDAADALPTVAVASRLGYDKLNETLMSKLHLYSDNNKPTIGYVFGECKVKPGDVVATENHAVRVVDVAYTKDIMTIADKATIGTQAAPVMLDGKPFPKNAQGAPVYPATSPRAGQNVEFDGTKAKWFYTVNEQVQAAWKLKTNAVTATSGTIKLTFDINGQSKSFQANSATADKAAVLKCINDILASVKSATKIVMTATAVDDKTFTIATTSLPSNVAAMSLTNAEMFGKVLAVEANDTKPTVATSTTVEKFQLLTVDANAGTVKGDGAPANIDMQAVIDTYGTAKPMYTIAFSGSIKSKLGVVEIDDTLSSGGILGKAMQLQAGDEVLDVTPHGYVVITTSQSYGNVAKMHSIRGILDKEVHYVNGTAARQNIVLDRLLDQGMKVSFGDPTVFRCRYMIDTFKTYIEPNAKHQFATLANESSRFPVITALPFYHELRTCKNPDFHDAVGQFQMSYVALGSNPDKLSTNSFSWPQDESAKWLIPVMEVMYNNGFSAKVVPGVGAVGKLYYSKLMGTRKVYDIVAGSEFAISATGVTGPGYEPAQPDRAAIEQLGGNVIMRINGVLQLYSNKTAYQAVTSAFNYPETIEKCLYVSDMVEPVLSGRIFKYNNADARRSVKQYADSVCDVMVSDGAIADYENKCDLENNPTDVRKAGIIVLDTVLYNEYGIRIAVHRTTIKDPEV